ncbi:MAG: hydrogenase maturation protease [Sedimentisphaerales bacterium]|nr:hydrogenase maturation protease [Sedimentisphaerales bacterium]
MSRTLSRVLVLCYGNPGRLDDGLGAAFGAALQEMNLPGVTVHIDYQLTVENALAVADHDVVLFVDAAVAGREPFFFLRLAAEPALGFSTHSLEPPQVLAMAQEYFGRIPAAYALGIRGYDYNEFGETLSGRAQQNLTRALQCLVPVMQHRTFQPFAAQLQQVQERESRDNQGGLRCKMENM